ncbi:hypothetical protein G7054_g4668 [Neopestalotiopsis clavispora]|nr:hypothetical protein G7054_g4668 [Neopestalotiopsis clavispora]
MTISITIKNRSMTNLSLVLIQDLPAPNNVRRDQLFTNVYQRSPKMSGSGRDQVTFQTVDEYYGIYGGTKYAEGNVKVSTSGSAKATLQAKTSSGPVNGSTFHLTTLQADGRSPTFGSTEQSTVAEGAFTIQSDGTFDGSGKYKLMVVPSLLLAERRLMYRDQRLMQGWNTIGNIFFGVGARDPETGEVVPIQTYRAQPNFSAVLYPVVKYYIAFGNYEPGTIVNKAELGRVLSLDFTGISLNDVTFTLNDRNGYEIEMPRRDLG